MRRMENHKRMLEASKACPRGLNEGMVSYGKRKEEKEMENEDEARLFLRGEGGVSKVARSARFVR